MEQTSVEQWAGRRSRKLESQSHLAYTLSYLEVRHLVQMATVSSKVQEVIPTAIRKKLRITGGTKLAVSEQDGSILLTPNPYDALLALRGCLSHVEEDVEAWWMEEKCKEREREDAKIEELL